MNDYTVDWPFWGEDGLCADGDPELPPDLSARIRRWAARFNAEFSAEHGWPDAATAAEHEAEGARLHLVLGQSLPEHEIEFHYWERAYQSAR